MTKHDEARRAFLLGAAVGAGAVAGATLVPDALAQTHDAPTTGTGPAHAHAGGPGLGAFFNSEDAATVAAFTERLVPGAPGKPGARDAYCRKTYKEPFRQLSAAQQDEVIAALEQGKASEFSWPSAAAFFNTVRTHTMEGMFADPIYGGNKDFTGWRLVGFPGGQLEFTAADMQSSGPFTRLPIVGLQAKAG